LTTGAPSCNLVLGYKRGYILGYNKDYLRKVNNIWQYYRRTPKSVSHLDKRVFVKKSLKTDSRSTALQRAARFNKKTEEYWQALLNHQGEEATKRYEAAAAIARSFGFSYTPSSELIAADDYARIVQRIEAINERDSIGNAAVVDAILGNVPAPALTLTAALEEYWKHTQDQTRHKTPRELNDWKAPRKRAVKHFTKIVGDKNMSDISRDDTLDFRLWWQARINDEGLKANSANKDIGHLCTIFRTIDETLRLHLSNPFENLHLSERNDRSDKQPFDPDYVQNTLLNLTRLSGLNHECQMILFAMADTGCGFSELTGLDSSLGEIRLDADIPFIDIKPNEHRSLKTSRQKKDYRKRQMPLVGSALYAFQQCPEGFPTYCGKHNTASTTTNKFLRENGLLPSGNHSAYSLRHTFEDRLTTIETPDKIDARLMGHKYHRPDYGKGPSLEQKHNWLLKIAFSVNPD